MLFIQFLFMSSTFAFLGPLQLMEKKLNFYFIFSAWLGFNQGIGYNL